MPDSGKASTVRETVPRYPTRETIGHTSVLQARTARAGWAALALSVYSEQVGDLDETVEVAVGELITDLLHLLDLEGGGEAGDAMVMLDSAVRRFREDLVKF